MMYYKTKSKYNNLFGTLIFILIPMLIFAQERVDTADFINYAKLKTLAYSDNKVKSYKYIQDFLNYKPKTRFVKSSGFSQELLFFELIVVSTPDTANKIPIDSNTYYLECFFSSKINPDTFVFCYNIKSMNLFMLKPIYDNDIVQMFDNSLSYRLGNPCFNSFKTFSDCFHVESNIDWKTIFKIYKSRLAR